MKLLKFLSTFGFFPASFLSANLVFNPDFGEIPPEVGWFLVDHNGPNFSPPVSDSVTFDGPIATFDLNGSMWRSFFQEFSDLTPGLEHTFSVDIRNASLGGAMASVLFVEMRYESGAFFSVVGSTVAPISEGDGLYSVTWTPTGVWSDTRFHVGIDVMTFNPGAIPSARLELGNPRLIAVPEPSTYALIIGALGLAWVLYRRRR